MRTRASARIAIYTTGDGCSCVSRLLTD